MIRPISALLAMLCLTGCPAFYVDRGELVQPTRSITRPAVSQLPRADKLVELESSWKREARIGVAGAVVGILRDPALVAASVSHQAALQGLDRDATRELLVTEWTNAFGRELDRWSIDLDLRFDEQFAAHETIMDAGTWTFTLYVDDADYKPMAVTTLSKSEVPVQHFWETKIRLWFPWRDHEHDRVLLGGNTRGVRLSLEHPSGDADLGWRFRTAY